MNIGFLVSSHFIFMTNYIKICLVEADMMSNMLLIGIPFSCREKKILSVWKLLVLVIHLVGA